MASGWSSLIFGILVFVMGVCLLTLNISISIERSHLFGIFLIIACLPALIWGSQRVLGITGNWRIGQPTWIFILTHLGVIFAILALLIE